MWGYVLGIVWSSTFAVFVFNQGNSNEMFPPTIYCDINFYFSRVNSSVRTTKTSCHVITVHFLSSFQMIGKHLREGSLELLQKASKRSQIHANHPIEGGPPNRS